MKCLVRRPSPRLADGLLTHIDRQPVDADLALRQWQAYVDALAEFGWEPVEVPAAPELPDGVFVEDTMVWWQGRAVITRPGAPARRDEIPAVEQALAGLGVPATRIEAPGTLDGGDVLKIGDRFYAGVGGRTNLAGIQQLGELLGVEVQPVPVTKVLHLKSAVTALPDGTVIGYPPLVDDPGYFKDFLAVPEEPGSHVVVLDDTTVLMASSAPLTADILRGRGLEVVAVDISEFEKLEGCVTCLSVRLR
ncbi:MAG: arginine deiminase family protein [Candidatus Nanopelagicales bacterium]|nr:arginine deiminase family protein [Candidatus Nanopelagicales bacterium]